jgi:uncharacterized protein (TIGR02452 family)
MSRRPFRSKRQIMLSAVAQETKAALPDILAQLPSLDATESSLHKLDDCAPLKAEDAPGFVVESGTSITAGFVTRIVNADTLDTAIALSKEPATDSSSSSKVPAKPLSSRVCILNLASERTPGGGWLGGSLAQEESICYRSSLALSLHRRDYPLGETSAIYTPVTVIIRDEFGAGHELIKNVPANELDVVSVVSVAALRRPDVTRAQKIIAGEIADREVFADPRDRDLTKRKMRLTLRVCALHGHTRLVLGALGCGAFRNPAEDVAACWREVLGEAEFAGWFDKVMFAVLDKGSDGKNAGRGGLGNFGVFEKILGGVVFTGAESGVQLEDEVAKE